MVYFDTSVAIALFVPEPTSEAAEAWFAFCTDRLVSSDWLLTEFASALLSKARRKEIAKTQATAIWKYFWEFSRCGLRLPPVSRSAFDAAARLARNVASGLRSGDSQHLAMAIEAGAACMATTDGNLAKNATTNGVAVEWF